MASSAQQSCPARYRIEVLGPFSLTSLVDGSTIPLRSNGRLITRLASQAPSSIPRKVLVNELWPDVEPSAAHNRLRVALSKLRQMLPGAILESTDGLSLNLDLVECDALEFLELAREAGDTTGEEEEFDSLWQAVQYFARRIGSRKFEGWNLPDLEKVLETYKAVSLRAAALGLRFHRSQQVAEICSSALAIWEIDRGLWKLFLQARLNMGQGEAAFRELAATKDRALMADPEIRQLVDKILRKDAPEAAGKLAASEAKLASEILAIALDARPDLARALLSLPETLSVAGSNPRPMLALLERVVGESLPGDEQWERCMARICGLKAWLGDAQGVFEYGARIVQNSRNPVILRASWNAISLAHSLRRQWQEAMDSIQTTIDYAEETGNEIDVLSAEGNRASYLWQQGRYAESEREYDRILARVRELGTPQANFEYVIGLGNRAFIPVMQGDWSRALRWIEECYDLRTNGEIKVPMGTLLPCLAMTRMAIGESSGVFRLLRQGFVEANESGSERFQQITFEFAACALAFTPHRGYARAVIDWVENWRIRTLLPRARAEHDLCSVIFGRQQPTSALGEDDPPALVGRELLKRLRQSLRS